MNLEHNVIVIYAKRLTFILVLFTLVLKPLIETITFINDSNYELVIIDVELDTNDEEHQEEESNVEKEILQLASSYCHLTYTNIKNTNTLYYLSLNSSFEIAINIPPPDLG